MPPKRYRSRKPARSHKRKRARYGRRRGGKLRTIRRGTNAPFAQNLITTLKYSDTISISGTNTAVDYIFNTNNVFDPDQTGVGHQPIGYDQITPVYARYRVLSCDWSLSWVSTNANGTVICVVPTNDNTSLVGNAILYRAAREYKYAKFGTMANGGSPVKLHGHVNCATLNGKTMAEYKGDENTAAIVTASPAEQLPLHIVCGDTAGVAVSIGGIITIMLKYTVEFFDPYMLGGS